MNTGFKFLHYTSRRSLTALPNPHGSMTPVIRRLYMLDLLQWIADLAVSNRNRGYSREIAMIRTPKQLTQIMKTYFTNLDILLEHSSQYFELNKDKTYYRLRQPQNFMLGVDSLLQMLDGLIPVFGAVRLETVAALSNDSSVQEIFSYLSDEKVKDKYLTVRNTQGISFVYRKEDSDVSMRGLTVGDNKAVAIILHAASVLLPTVPDYFVPYDECVKNLSTQDLDVVQVTSLHRIVGILGSDLESGYFNNRQQTFIRRKLKCERSDLPPCYFEYEPYNVTRIKAIKFALCLPSEPIHIREVPSHFFPKLASWGREKSAYTPWDIIQMFPTVMQALPNGMVKSIVRAKFPMLAPDVTLPYSESAEDCFDQKLSSPDLENVRNELMSLTSVQDGFYLLDNQLRVHKKKDGTKSLVSREGQSYTDEQALSLMLQYVGDLEEVPLEEVTYKVKENLSEEEQQMFRQAIYLRHSGSLVKLIRKNPSFGLHLTEHRKPNSSSYHFRLRRGNGCDQADKENPFMNENNLLDEIAMQIREVKQKSVDGAMISSITNRLPTLARKAVKKFGGMLEFLSRHREKFRVTDAKYVLLLSRSL